MRDAREGAFADALFAVQRIHGGRPVQHSSTVSKMLSTLRLMRACAETNHEHSRQQAAMSLGIRRVMRGAHGDGDGRQHQQRAHRLVRLRVERLVVVLRPADQEAAACAMADSGPTSRLLGMSSLESHCR